MSKLLNTLTIVLLATTSCTSQGIKDDVIEKVESENSISILNPEGTKISERFTVPEGFERTKELENSFQSYLRDLPLKPDGSDVLYFDGRKKSNLY